MGQQSPLCLIPLLCVEPPFHSMGLLPHRHFAAFQIMQCYTSFHICVSANELVLRDNSCLEVDSLGQSLGPLLTS